MRKDYEIAPADLSTASDEKKGRKAANEKKHELCQQWRSAQGAADAAHVAWWQLWTGFGALAGLGLTVYFTAQSAISAGEAAQAARRSADVAAKALLDLERALVAFKEIHRVGGAVRDARTDKDTVFFKVEVENSGTTRTRHLVNYVTFREFAPEELVNWELGTDFSYPDVQIDSDPAPFVLSPKASVKLGAFGITMEGLERMARGQTRGYLWGWAEYDDIFDGTPRRRTEYCFWISKVTPPYSVAGVEWTNYKEHNGMDSECPPERFRTTKDGVWIEPRRARMPRT